MPLSLAQKRRFYRILQIVTACCACNRLVVAAHQQGDPSIIEFFRVTLGLKSKDTSNRNNPQPLQVIGAGLPRTGTASFVNALSKLGLHSYHMKDGAIETPGHLDLWYRLYHPEDKSIGSGEVSFGDILDDMAIQGFTATSDGPSCFWYKEQMKRYPDARVVLTVRGDGSGEAWERSFSTNIIDVLVSMQDIPYSWFPMFQKIDGMARAMLDPLGVELDPKTKFPRKDELPGAYERWVQQVKATVPEDKLLVYAAQDGWAPLCEFLSPLSAEIEAKCQSILASGETYPNVNDSAKVQALMVFLRGVSTLCRFSPLLAMVATFMLMSKRGSRNKAKAE